MWPKILFAEGPQPLNPAEESTLLLSKLNPILDINIGEYSILTFGVWYAIWAFGVFQTRSGKNGLIKYEDAVEQESEST